MAMATTARHPHLQNECRLEVQLHLKFWVRARDVVTF